MVLCPVGLSKKVAFCVWRWPSAFGVASEHCILLVARNLYQWSGGIQVFQSYPVGSSSILWFSMLNGMAVQQLLSLAFMHTAIQTREAHWMMTGHIQKAWNQKTFPGSPCSSLQFEGCQSGWAKENGPYHSTWVAQRNVAPIYKLNLRSV